MTTALVKSMPGNPFFSSVCLPEVLNMNAYGCLIFVRNGMANNVPLHSIMKDRYGLPALFVSISLWSLCRSKKDCLRKTV